VDARAAAHAFVGAYLALAVALLAMGVMALIEFPAVQAPPRTRRRAGRWGRSCASRCSWWPAGRGLGYGVMNLLMAATPLAMQVCGFEFGATAMVLQWHVIGMYAPGFFTGSLIKRFGVLPVMGAGVVLNLACVGIALSGVELMHFVSAAAAGRGLELSVHRQHHAGAGRLPAGGKDRAQAAINSACSPPWR
jgi:hypothetical protein